MGFMQLLTEIWAILKSGGQKISKDSLTLWTDIVLQGYHTVLGELFDDIVSRGVPVQIVQELGTALTPVLPVLPQIHVLLFRCYQF